jgi:hypothetical protein
LPSGATAYLPFSLDRGPVIASAAKQSIHRM